MSRESETNEIMSGKCAVIGKAEFSGIKADILLGGENAPMTVMDLTVEPSLGAPAHISKNEDKVFFVKEGCFVFLVGTQKTEATAGDTIFVSKGTVHSFSALNQTCGRMTLVSTPGLHDQFFVAMSDLPTPHSEDQVQSVCNRFGQAIVGPVIEP